MLNVRLTFIMPKTDTENVKNLSLVIERIPFSVCTNLIMPKNRRERKIPKRYENADIFKSPKRKQIIQENNKHPHQEQNINKNQVQIVLNRNPEVENLIENKNKNIRVSTPLVNRLRKFDKKDYFECSLNESINKTKIPIYKRNLPAETKTNIKDPYAFNYDKPKEEKLNNFDKIMHDALIKIEKKDKKKKKIVRKKTTYNNNINKALNKVMMKINTKKDSIDKEQINNINLTNSDQDFLGFEQLSTCTNNPGIEFNKTGIDSSEGFIGFDNRLNLTENQLVPTNIDSYSTPKKPRINILTNVCLRNNIIEKSHYLQKEFHNNDLLNNETVQSYDHFDVDDYMEDDEENEDEYFGFTEIDENPPVNKNIKRRGYYVKKHQPWRFQGIFKRNPHILIIKKNGLPSQQQDMVIDYEFVKRIEDLIAKNSNKHPEPPPPKSPIQSKIIDFIETEQEFNQQSIRCSLFNYEEFNIPKKILGDNNQIISTPKKNVINIVVSPNVSIIPKNQENRENYRKIYKSYKRKLVIEKDIDDSDNHLFEDIDEENDIDLSIKLPEYGKKTHRKRQISEGSDGEGKKTKKKKKDLMTKTEQAEFNSWIAKTNAGFDEINKHELTIE